MGIDIYLEWPGMTEEERKKQVETLWSLDGGKVGYLREAYHGQPYATQILVREAFESDSCQAEIPAAVLRERMTRLTEPVYGKVGGHDTAKAIGEVLQQFVGDDQSIHLGGICQGQGQTAPMSVEEAITERAQKLYGASPEEVRVVKNSFWAFVRLAEQKEKQTGKPCTVIASY
jgi:hypothetical protein